jgi:ATP phosphoribosyltransferase
LVARDDEAAASFSSMLRAVVEARRHRYLMLNVPESALGAICDLVAPRTPSVLRSQRRGWWRCTRSCRPPTSGAPAGAGGRRRVVDPRRAVERMAA